MADSLGKKVLASALPWLLTGGAILLLIYLIRKEFGEGGFSEWLRKLLGLNAPAPIAEQTETQQDAFGEDHDSSGVGAQAVTGHFAIKSDDVIQLHNNLNLTTTMEVPLNLVNSSPKKQQVEVQIDGYVDYAFSDESITWAQLIDVGALESKRVVANLNLSLNAVPFRGPKLFLDLTVAGVHQDRVERIGTG